jgi:hypothetical protein
VHLSLSAIGAYWSRLHRGEGSLKLKIRKTVKSFEAFPKNLFPDEKRFRALKTGDRIAVWLEDKAQVKGFRGFGTRSPLCATASLGPDYSYFFVDGGRENNPQTAHHVYAVDRSRLIDILDD